MNPPRPLNTPDAPARPPRPMWQLVAGVLGLSLVLIALAVAVPWWTGRLDADDTAQADGPGVPWQIDTAADGSLRVLGLQLGGAQPSTLAQVQARWPAEVLKVAIIETPGDGGPRRSLEAYLESVRAQTVQGRLVVSAAADDADLDAWAGRATEREPTPSGARRLGLTADDRAAALRHVVKAIVFLPAARFDETAASQRFGAPAQRITDSAGAVHLLYPSRGLAIALDASGQARPVLQYVAPADFDARLLAPLRAAPASAVP